MKKTKTFHFDSKYMKEKLQSPKVKFEVSHGRLVFKTLGEAIDYFIETEGGNEDKVLENTRFDRWFEECNIRIKE
jgi:hypothetical protein